MKRLFQGALGALSISMLLAVGAPASAQISVTANGPYYATPSWSQKLTKNRFVVLADWNHEAVLDRETGLVWERSPLAIYTNWGGAVNHCYAKTVGQRSSWRLPSLPEMASLLVQPGLGQQRELPEGHPFENVTPGAETLEFWTSTRWNDVNERAFIVPLRGVLDADTDSFFPTRQINGNRRFWCVRGGESAPSLSP